MQGVNNLNDMNFDSEIRNSTVPVLVDFWAQWCGPCRMLGPVVEQVASEIEGRAKICKLNVDDSPQTASRYGIMSIPTILIFKNGDVVGRMVGVRPKQEIMDKLSSL